jgi:hypothetical protein
MITKDDIKSILKDLLPKLERITIQTMVYRGIKQNSNLAKSVDYKVTEKGVDMIANDYWTYASSGRRPYTRKVPIRDLIDYIKRYNIRPKNGQTLNQLAFAIQTSIYKNGINPKNYTLKVVGATSDLTEETISSELVDVIADDVANTLKE